MSALPVVLLSLVPTPVSQRAPAPAPGQSPAAVSAAKGCADSIRDRANPGDCIQASSVPALGRIFPLSASLFVSTSGRVGFGTTSPTQKLEIAGAARVNGTVATSGADPALDVAAGSIYKGGVLFIHTRGGSTAIGLRAADYFCIGNQANTAIGEKALLYHHGLDNTVVGFGALRYNGYAGGGGGDDNVAIGSYAAREHVYGDANTALGEGAMGYFLQHKDNTAIGSRALFFHAAYRNIGLGHEAGLYVFGSDNILIGNVGTGENGRIRIGTPSVHTSAFLAGVRGVTTANANAIPVVIDGDGQLGTVSSSRRFKEEIDDMGDRTERLLALRPVVFRFNPEIQSGERPLEYGLIAEEVAEVFPELVVNDAEGKPLTVKYHLLDSMLLNELERLHEEVSARRAKHGRKAEELQEVQARLRELEERLTALESGEG